MIGGLEYRLVAYKLSYTTTLTMFAYCCAYNFFEIHKNKQTSFCDRRE